MNTGLNSSSKWLLGKENGGRKIPPIQVCECECTVCVYIDIDIYIYILIYLYKHKNV